MKAGTVASDSGTCPANRKASRFQRPSNSYSFLAFSFRLRRRIVKTSAGKVFSFEFLGCSPY